MVAISAGKSPPGMAEQYALDKCFRQGGTIYDNKIFIRARVTGAQCGVQ